MTISKIEKFINLKIPSDIPNIPLLRGFLYMRLFYYLVFKLNGDQNKKKYYYLLILLYFISVPWLYFVFTFILALTNQIDFLKNIKLGIFQNDIFRYFLEIIFYISTFWILPYFNTALGQKLFDKILKKIIIKTKGRIDSTNYFSFLDNLDPDKYNYYHYWIEKILKIDPENNNHYNKLPKKWMFSKKVRWEHRKVTGMFDEDNNISYIYAITYYNSYFRNTKIPNIPLFFYYNFMLRIFIFNSKNNIYNEITKENKLRFRIAYLVLISLSLLASCIGYIIYMKYNTFLAEIDDKAVEYLLIFTFYFLLSLTHFFNIFYQFAARNPFIWWTLYEKAELS
ncbi:Uncharacterised protein [Mesomycoplasma conjunctivae]|uniref:Uncharacterized protein n=1 Tax=Mesomycoplasma conjunctivae (strain ATCC 25834 / NCTC 10147 / HRC/581) TaxID=572263 RepID=C5J626_MESCH|nr:hypothetical protein [Mesomycoplasma conjunctivae]CAT04918.1 HYPOTHETICAL PROTEIN MCJ_002270 [Mesomycoplasma conjunctivae]VEU66047.1 Uncharacterised protein [Mesomycoplasma conjunctivae]